MKRAQTSPAFLFDLDGTLVDSVYQHVLAWREALESCGFELAVWRIHRRVGRSGGLFASALLRETGKEVTSEQAEQLKRAHAAAYAKQVSNVRPRPGTRDLLSYLTAMGIPWAIATSSQKPRPITLGWCAAPQGSLDIGRLRESHEQRTS